MRNIYLEIKRALLGPIFVLAVLLQIVFLYEGAREDWPHRLGLDGFYLFAMGKDMGAAHFFVPILASLPYALSYCMEKRSGYSLLQYYRAKKASYITGKIIAVALSSGLALGLGTLLYAGGCILLSPQSSFRVEVWRTYGDGAWLEPYLHADFGRPFMYLCAFMDTIAGAAWGSMTLMFSVLLPNPIFAIMASQCVYMVFSSIPFLAKVFNPMAMVRPEFFNDVWRLERILSHEGLLLLLILLITVAAFFRQVKYMAFSRDRGKGGRFAFLNRLRGLSQTPRMALLLAASLLLLRPVFFLRSGTASAICSYRLWAALTTPSRPPHPTSPDGIFSYSP